LDSQAGDLTSQTQEENINVEVKKENQENINVVVNNLTENQSNHIVDTAETDLTNEKSNNNPIDLNSDKEVHKTEEKIENEAPVDSKENEGKINIKFLEKILESEQKNELAIDSEKREEKNIEHIEEKFGKEATEDVVENEKVQADIVQEKVSEDNAEIVEVHPDIVQEKVAEEVVETSKVQSEIQQETVAEDELKTVKDQVEVKHETVADTVEETINNTSEQTINNNLENAIHSNEKKFDEEIKLPEVNENSQEKQSEHEVVIENNLLNEEHKNTLQKEQNDKEEVGKFVEENDEKTVETLLIAECSNQREETVETLLIPECSNQREDNESKLADTEALLQIEPISVSVNTCEEEVKDNSKVVIDNEVDKTIIKTIINEGQTVETDENNVDIIETNPTESKQNLEDEAKVDSEDSKRKMDQQAEIVKITKDRIIGEVCVGIINNIILTCFRQKRNNNFTTIGKVF